MRKFQPLRHLYALLRRYSDTETIHAAVSRLARSPEFAAHFVRVCETLLQTPGPPSAA